MAARLPVNRINRYKDSAEERIVKEMLDLFFTERNGFSFYNLVIRSSNAREGSLFSDATISLQVLDDVNLLRNDLTCVYPKCGFVSMNDILNEAVLKRFSIGGVSAVEDDPESHAVFMVLLDFLHERSTHSKAIKKAFNSIWMDKSRVSTVLAQHLFSQLVPGNVCEVDGHQREVPTLCPCGCEANIVTGNTSIGSRGTWHGSVDILVNHTVPVSVIQYDSEDKAEVHNYSHEHDDRPVRKKRKREKGGENDSSDFASTDEKVLYSTKVLQKIFAESITNSFAQGNTNQLLSEYLVPTFGATSEHVTVCLYDSEHDYLFYIKQALYLWTAENKFNIVTIMIIWLFLNFTVFTKNSFHSFLHLDKSSLHEDLGKFLELYKKAETKGYDDSWTPHLHFKDVIPKFHSRREST